MIFTDQFDRNGGSVESIYFFALFPRAHLTLVSVRQWDAKKLRRFCKQDKAWCDIVGNRLSFRKKILNIVKLKMEMITKHEDIISCHEVNVFGNLKTIIRKILRHLELFVASS